MNIFDFSSKDQCMDMLENATFNPFRVSDAETNLELPDFMDAFRQDLKGQFADATLMKYMGPKKIVKSYIFNMAESYYNNAGHIPCNILDDIIRQVHMVVCSLGYGDEVVSYEDIRYEMYYALLHN